MISRIEYGLLIGRTLIIKLKLIVIRQGICDRKLLIAGESECSGILNGESDTVVSCIHIPHSLMITVIYMGMEIVPVIIIDIEFVVHSVYLILRITDTVCIGSDCCSEETGISVIILCLVKTEYDILCLSFAIRYEKSYKNGSEIGNIGSHSVSIRDSVEHQLSSVTAAAELL